jgi:nucleoid-associated protein YgaU
MSLISAYIQLEDGEQVRFPYNPESISVTKTAVYHSTPQASQEAGQKNYLGSEPQSMTVTLLLDTFAVPPNPPGPAIATLERTLVAVPGINDNKPPSVMFGWGTNIVMSEAKVKSMTITYKRFLFGQPVRAEVSLSLEKVSSTLGAQNPTSGALASRRTHTVIEGDSLASIAFKEFGRADKWRALAEANGIDDPMRIRPGTELLVPDPAEADALA